MIKRQMSFVQPGPGGLSILIIPRRARRHMINRIKLFYDLTKAVGIHLTNQGRACVYAKYAAAYFNF